MAYSYIPNVELCLERAVELEADYKYIKKYNYKMLILSHEALQDITLRIHDLNSARASDITDEEIEDWTKIYEFLLNLPSPESIKAKYNLRFCVE